VDSRAGGKAMFDNRGNLWVGDNFTVGWQGQDKLWQGNESIAVFNNTGKPLTPPEGLNFGGKLGLMQGIIATPRDDVWVLRLSKNQLLNFPKGDPNQGKIRARSSARVLK
jgi:hypothetical protein